MNSFRLENSWNKLNVLCALGASAVLVIMDIIDT